MPSASSPTPARCDCSPSWAWRSCCSPWAWTSRSRACSRCAREVFGLGGGAGGAHDRGVRRSSAHLLGVPWLVAIVLGGAIAMSSTAILLQQLTERSELNRTHGRLAFSMLLFQDLAFVPFLALASALTAGGTGSCSCASGLVPVLGGSAGHRRRARRRALAAAAAVSCDRSQPPARAVHPHGAAGGAGLGLGRRTAPDCPSPSAPSSPGMMLAETEYRHQIEAVIRPFRDILLGLFFISVGMLLDLHLLGRPAAARARCCSCWSRWWCSRRCWPRSSPAPSRPRASRRCAPASSCRSAGSSASPCARSCCRRGCCPSASAAPLLVAMVLSMVLSPLDPQQQQARRALPARRAGPGAHRERARGRRPRARSRVRDHVILCGFGRVGQNVARVLESQGFEYIALDLDPARIRAARQAGDPVMFGDSSDEEMLGKAGLAAASAVVISFSDPATSIGILRSVRARAPGGAGAGAHPGRCAHRGAAGRRGDRRGAGDLRGEPDAGLARADAAARAGVARGAHARGDPQQPLRGAAQHRAPRRRAPAR